MRSASASPTTTHLRMQCIQRCRLLVLKWKQPALGQLMHLLRSGHPVLRWNMDSAFVRTEPAGNLKIDKEKTTEKVDGAGQGHEEPGRRIRLRSPWTFDDLTEV